ncbi:MAG: hypothetical protein ACK5Q5_03950 [Planctomycetaceae bacterium]
MINRDCLHRLAGLTTGLWLATLPGCMTMYPNGGYTTWKFSDPPLRSTVPAAQPSANPTPAPQQPASAQPQSPSPEPTYSTDSGSNDAPQVTIRQKLDAPAPGPELMAPGSTNGNARADGVLALNVLAPTQGTLGEPVQYEIRLANRAGSGLSDVVLECEFDAGLEFPGSTEQQIRRPLGTLAAGATQSIPLTLTPQTPGQHCVRFRLSAKDQPSVERESCLRVVDEGLEIQVVAPVERLVGQRAEFVLTIHNRSGHALTAARVEAQYGRTLAAREASAGVIRDQGVLKWDLETLQIDERVQIQMEFECLASDPRVCVALNVSTDTTTAAEEACLTISPAPNGVTLSISDSIDPVAIGDALTYRLEVRNASPAVVENWSIEINVDDTISLDQARITAPAAARQPQQRREAGQLLLSGFPALSAGETLTLELPARALRAGRTQLDATIQSPRESISFTEPTLVNPPAITP